jgi:multidrug/hemolysin transport system permease protein
LPIGILPEAVQLAIKLFPPSHAAMLLRQTLMEQPLQTAFAEIPADHLQEFNEVMGIVFLFGENEIPPILSVMFLAASAIIFFALSLLFSRNKKSA